VRYNARPRYYVHDKNDMYLRETPTNVVLEEVTPEEREQLTIQSLPDISTADRVRIEDIIANPQAKLHFKTNRKGGISVHITEVK
jgi:hypothetical protein